MLTVKASHTQYQNFVETFLEKFFIQNNQQITLFERSTIITKIWSVDLTGIVPLIQSTYSKSNQGAPPKDAVALLRSLIIMAYCKETSISSWIKTLRSEPFYAILSGFIPACYAPFKAEGILADQIPGIGTFYDFMDRLIYKDKALYKSKLRKVKRKPTKKQKKNQKMNNSKSGVVERLVKRVLKYDNSKLCDRIESKMNTILKELFVIPSLSMGILGDPSKLNIAGDGTCMPSQASPYGKKVCDCKLKPGERCDCYRKFTDPSASWGWDSFNEHYYYGHTYHGFTACDSFYSLPIHIKFVSAARHDSVTGVYELKELVDLYPEINFHSVVLDSAYDSNAFYLLCMHYGINPIIDLNSRSSKPSSGSEFVKLDDKGIPYGKICGHQLRNWGIIRKEYRRKWLFPVQCNHCEKCPIKSNKTYYTKTLDNPRYFTPILRGSKQWKSLYKRRSTTERCWDRINNDFHAEKAIIYSVNRRITRVFLGSFCCFIDAWAKEKIVTIADIFPTFNNIAA
jgi:hypothetical protein